MEGGGAGGLAGDFFRFREPWDVAVADEFFLEAADGEIDVVEEPGVAVGCEDDVLFLAESGGEEAEAGGVFEFRGEEEEGVSVEGGDGVVIEGSTSFIVVTEEAFAGVFGEVACPGFGLVSDGDDADGLICQGGDGGEVGIGADEDGFAGFEVGVAGFEACLVVLGDAADDEVHIAAFADEGAFGGEFEEGFADAAVAGSPVEDHLEPGGEAGDEGVGSDFGGGGDGLDFLAGECVG